jgi:hypothetical protein
VSLLEVKPPKRLDNALELPRLWRAVKKFVKAHFAPVRKEKDPSGVRKAIKKNPTLSWPW